MTWIFLAKSKVRTGNEKAEQIITRNETWVFQYNRMCKIVHSPRPKEVQTPKSEIKIKSIAFLYQKDLGHHELRLTVKQ